MTRIHWILQVCWPKVMEWLHQSIVGLFTFNHVNHTMIGCRGDAMRYNVRLLLKHSNMLGTPLYIWRQKQLTFGVHIHTNRLYKALVEWNNVVACKKRCCALCFCTNQSLFLFSHWFYIHQDTYPRSIICSIALERKKDILMFSKGRHGQWEYTIWDVCPVIKIKKPGG